MLGYFVLLMAVGVTYPDVRSDCGPHQALEDTTCVQCPTCPVGTGLSKTCGYGHGGYQRCLPCPEGSYHSDVADSMCVPCADCAWYRRAVKYRCRTVINAECGQCLPGYFDDETDARDRSILTRCTTCSAMPNAPECREISVPLAKVTETTSTMDTPRADARGHGDAILALQILSMVFCLCVCLYVGYKYIQSKRPGAGRCLHVNFWCKGSRLAEEGVVGGTEVILDGSGGHHEMENFSNHRREGEEMTGSEEEALIDSRTGGDTTIAHGENRDARDPIASTSQGNCRPNNGQLKRLFEREDWPNSKHGDGNEYNQTSCIKQGCSEMMDNPKPPVDQIEKRDHVHNYIPGKSGEQIEKPPAVVQSIHQMAAPTIDDVLMNPTNREPQEVFIDFSKCQLDHGQTSDLPPIILPEGPEGSGLKHKTKQIADSMEDDQNLMRVFGLQAISNDEGQMHSRNTPQSSSDVQTSASTSSSVSMISTGYPSQGSTLLIRDISIDNHLGSEHGGSEISIQGTDRGMSILTASDNLSLREQRGPKMSLRAPDSFRQKDNVKEPARPLRRCSTLPQLLRGPFTDISNIANESCSCKISSPSMPWERVRSDMRVPDDENRAKPEQSVKHGNRVNERQTVGDTQNNIHGEVRNVNLNGNTTTTNSGAGGHNLNIHINNNFMPPQLTGTDTTIDLRSLFETGNLNLHDLNLGNSSRENQVGDSPDNPNVRQPGALIKTSPSQTRPKEVSPLLPRGCGMASRKDTALPVQETVKS